MSMQADLARVFRNLSEEYGWTKEETINHFMEAAAALEWEFYHGDVPRGGDGFPSFQLLEQIERAEAAYFLFGEE